MTIQEQRAAAEAFAQEWAARPGDEDQETQQFWTQLLREVYGVHKPEAYVNFEKKVKARDGRSTKKIDVYLPDTRVLIEQKSSSKELERVQGGGYGDITPYQQAAQYNELLGLREKARWIVTCNFREIRVHDMNRDTEPERAEPAAVVRLEDLPKRYADLSFLVDISVKAIAREQEEISAQATEHVSRLYNALQAEYEDPESPETFKHLNRLCVRLVFCYFAEDAGIFAPNQLTHYLARRRDDPDEVREDLLRAFAVMDTPYEQRDKYMKQALRDFPYVNGGLFSGASQTEVPRFTPAIVDILIRTGEEFDWSAISPTVFGAMFESTLNPETRHAGGMHYTSTENIHKVIDPLFLDDLRAELDDILRRRASAQDRRRALQDFQAKLASLTFLDPACGSGNFLTETYLSLRELENQAIAAGYGHEGRELALDLIRVNISQFYGIEINDFAVAVAKTALWIAESQMLEKTKKIVYGLREEVLPLKSYHNIVEGNALRLDWESVIPREKLNYIIGNPPFLGAMKELTAEQKADMKALLGAVKGVGELDYVCGWYQKAVSHMQGTSIRAALVSTNSICQGQHALTLWPHLFSQGVCINFAHRTFRWDNEAARKAAVHCVIVGMAMQPSSDKLIFDHTQPNSPIQAKMINQYLLDADTTTLVSRSNPICDVPHMDFGSMPRGKGFVITPEEIEHIKQHEPLAVKWIRPYWGAEEFINKKERWCLWLVGASPAELTKCPTVLRHVEIVRGERAASKAAATRKLAASPTLFAQIAQPQSSYLLVPRVSSERRFYLPIGYVDPEVIASDAAQVIPNATVYHFAILTSHLHNAWMRTVAGRLEMRYRYSKDIVYNNFPWPEANEAQQAAIGALGQAVLDARALYPECSLADLYDPLSMPPELLKAHRALDRAVLKLYGLKPSASEPEMVAELFRRYQELTRPGK